MRIPEGLGRGSGVEANIKAIEVTVSVNKRSVSIPALKGRYRKVRTAKVPVEPGRRPMQAEIVKVNKRTVIVRLPDGNFIKRKIQRDMV